MPGTRMIVISVLLAGWSGCRQPPASEGLEGPAMSARPRPRPRPRTADARRQPQPPRARPRNAPPRGDRRAQRAACRALYVAQLKAFAPRLARLELQRKPAALEAAYGLDTAAALRGCEELSSKAFECVRGQPKPLLPASTCAVIVPLGLRPPAALLAQLTPRRPAVDPGAALRVLAGLRGRWVHEGTGGRRTELLVAANGRATFRRLVGQRQVGDPETSVLSMTRAGELLRQRAVIAQPLVFFQPNRNTFFLSANPLHSATPVVNRRRFRLFVAPHRMLRVAGDICEVIDLAHLTVHAAQCRWDTDASTRVDRLTVTYRLGAWTLRDRFFYLRAHLLHEQLYARRFVRR